MSFNFMAAVTVCSDFGAQEKKIFHYFHFFPIYLPWSVGTGCHGLGFLNVALSQFFRFPLSPSSRGSLVLLHSLPLKWYHLHIWGKMLKVLNVNSATVSTVSPSICHEVIGSNAMIFVFWLLSFKSTFSLSSLFLKSYSFVHSVIIFRNHLLDAK